VIVGHHPHVVEEMEIYKNRPIFYSLGNFVFDQYFSIPTQQELAVKLSFVTKVNKKLLEIKVFPLESNKSQISQMSSKKVEKFWNDWIKRSRLNNNKFNNFEMTLIYD
jgi:poly-gamma-glutamate synthesis protein (capsule biosynthesis protein)